MGNSEDGHLLLQCGGLQLWVVAGQHAVAGNSDFLAKVALVLLPLTTSFGSGPILDTQLLEGHALTIGRQMCKLYFLVLAPLLNLLLARSCQQAHSRVLSVTHSESIPHIVVLLRCAHEAHPPDQIEVLATHGEHAFIIASHGQELLCTDANSTASACLLVLPLGANQRLHALPVLVGAHCLGHPHGTVQPAQCDKIVIVEIHKEGTGKNTGQNICIFVIGGQACPLRCLNAVVDEVPQACHMCGVLGHRAMENFPRLDRAEQNDMPYSESEAHLIHDPL